MPWIHYNSFIRYHFYSRNNLSYSNMNQNSNQPMVKTDASSKPRVMSRRNKNKRNSIQFVELDQKMKGINKMHKKKLKQMWEKISPYQ